MRRDSRLKYGVLFAAFVCMVTFLQPHGTSQVDADGSTHFSRQLGLPVSPWFHYEYVATPDGATSSVQWRIERPAWSWPFGIIGLSLIYWYWGLCCGWRAFTKNTLDVQVGTDDRPKPLCPHCAQELAVITVHRSHYGFLFNLHVLSCPHCRRVLDIKSMIK